MASPCAGAPVLKYGDVNTVTTSPGEVKGLNKLILKLSQEVNIKNYLDIITFLQKNKYDVNNKLIDQIIKEQDEKKRIINRADE